MEMSLKENISNPQDIEVFAAGFLKILHLFVLVWNVIVLVWGPLQGQAQVETLYFRIAVAGQGRPRTLTRCRLFALPLPYLDRPSFDEGLNLGRTTSTAYLNLYCILPALCNGRPLPGYLPDHSGAYGLSRTYKRF